MPGKRRMLQIAGVRRPIVPVCISELMPRRGSGAGRPDFRFRNRRGFPYRGGRRVVGPDRRRAVPRADAIVLAAAGLPLTSAVVSAGAAFHPGTGMACVERRSTGAPGSQTGEQTGGAGRDAER